MIKNRVVYGILAVLVIVFICAVGILPNLALKSKNTETSYVSKVFNHNKVTTVDLKISDSDYKDMLKNPLKEEMKEATVTVNGKTLEHVGVRTKGNLSLRSVANDKNSDRYSLKIDFDYYNDEQSLYGLKKLNLNNNYSDATQMREYLSYQLMEKMGLPTPSYAYMYVTINGKDRGLFLGVEQVDETFLAKNFGSNTGALYKPDGTGSDLQWISNNLDDYSGLNAKTKVDKDSEKATINFLKAINNKGKSLEDTANVDNLLRYFAVNTALVNLDSYQGNLKHNYYLYENQGIFNIIPWDYNMSFGGFGVGGGNGPQANQQVQNTGKDKNTDTSSKNSNAAQGKTSGNNMPSPPNGDANGQPSRTQPPQGQNGDGANAQQSNNTNNNSKTNNQTKSKDDKKSSNSVKQNAQGNLGMNGPSNSNLVSKSSINFSVTTPVSGTTLEERPLLNVLLSNDRYKKQYKKYLKEVATKYLTEDEIAEETAKIAKLIKPYVEKDPTKFYTTKEFENSVSGDNSLPEFAKQRSAAILQQLSDDSNVDLKSKSKATTKSTGTNKNTNSNTTNNYNNQFANPQGPGGNGGGFGQPGQNADQRQSTTGTSKANMIFDGGAVSLLLLAILFVLLFKRRGFKKVIRK